MLFASVPKSQMQNLYAGKPNKPQEKPKQVEVKKPEKKASKGPSEPQKPKPPKSIEAGLLSVRLSRTVGFNNFLTCVCDCRFLLKNSIWCMNVQKLLFLKPQLCG